MSILLNTHIFPSYFAFNCHKKVNMALTHMILICHKILIIFQFKPNGLKSSHCMFHHFLCVSVICVCVCVETAALRGVSVEVNDGLLSIFSLKPTASAPVLPCVTLAQSCRHSHIRAQRQIK